MKSVTVATQLKDDSTNVEVFTQEEFEKMIKLVGADNLYLFIPGINWETVSSYQQSNDISDLFNKGVCINYDELKNARTEFVFAESTVPESHKKLIIFASVYFYFYKVFEHGVCIYKGEEIEKAVDAYNNAT